MPTEYNHDTPSQSAMSIKEIKTITNDGCEPVTALILKTFVDMLNMTMNASSYMTPYSTQWLSTPSLPASYWNHVNNTGILVNTSHQMITSLSMAVTLWYIGLVLTVTLRTLSLGVNNVKITFYLTTRNLLSTGWSIPRGNRRYWLFICWPTVFTTDRLLY